MPYDFIKERFWGSMSIVENVKLKIMQGWSIKIQVHTKTMRLVH